MGRLLLFVMALVVFAGCGVPEVDLDLPERPGAPEAVPPVSLGQATTDDDAGDAGQGEPGADSSPDVNPPDPAELDELEQLVSEIESLLEGVSDELNQITFEEEGG